jgi:hypothetical protein
MSEAPPRRAGNHRRVYCAKVIRADCVNDRHHFFVLDRNVAFRLEASGPGAAQAERQVLNGEAPFAQSRTSSATAAPDESLSWQSPPVEKDFIISSDIRL